ncbi:putative PEP-binding protein [Xylanimonas ulmi]|uniref:Phosphoenolpyruvate-protein phosphotransferase n=1 Tax=Xylanimonas ulmi TaxID=228973 RepID=A0A4Q7M2V5_9MICO|nr:putative PEP-binding protein [Xylanibacterium ulmi]RZS60808.1 phosphoenolpyruvate--protein phosphotransferase [Xylanibacterium ulmi]
MTALATPTLAPLVGVGVGRGAAIGPVVAVAPAPAVPADEPAPADSAAAAARATQAFDEVAAALSSRAAHLTGAGAAILGASAAMASDPGLRGQTAAKIAAGTGPVTALTQVVDEFAQTFAAAGGYLAERVTDLRSVRDRVAARLLGQPEPGVPALTRPSVVVAEDLSPVDTAALDMSLVLAIATDRGGPTSHTAIIAGQHGIPCVMRAEGASGLPAGAVVAVDAAAGTVIPEPGPQVAEAFRRRGEVARALAQDSSPGALADGNPLALLANVGTPGAAAHAAGQSVEGVGLLRTEALFLGRATPPSHAEQAAAYAAVLTSFGERKVVIRTLDAGADKPLAFAAMPAEENPALGVRAYRLVRTRPSLLDTQLGAIADAAAMTGRMPWVMAPMIATPAEARDFARRARSHGLPTVGVMVEVPAAALRADAILAEVDFVSIGVDDLAQYTMAADRLRDELADLVDPFWPPVLDLVAATAAAGERCGKPVGVCGESASDPVMAVVLAGLGVTSLSMGPTAVPAVRYALSRHTEQEVRDVADAARSADGAPQARAAALAAMSPDVVEALTL